MICLADPLVKICTPLTQILKAVSLYKSNECIIHKEYFNLELAGLAEEEFGMDSNAMFNDLHAPSVPVHTNEAAAATKVSPHPSFALDNFVLSRMV